MPADIKDDPETILAYKVLKERLNAIKAKCSDVERAILAGIEQGRSKREVAAFLDESPLPIKIAKQETNQAKSLGHDPLLTKQQLEINDFDETLVARLIERITI